MPDHDRDREERRRSHSPSRRERRSTRDDRESGSSSSRRRDDSHRSSRDHDRHRSSRKDEHRHHSHRDGDRRKGRRTRSRSPDAGPSRREERPASLSAPPPLDDEEQPDEDAPNFAPSGLLAKESNNKDGVALKYHEPPEARKPKRPWRMYIFKDGKEIDMLTLGAGQSAYLLGRDRIVTDIPLDHVSCSKQHAVIQFRQTIEKNEFGDEKKRTRPFLIDLESANGCTVNQKEVPSSRFFEIKNGDTIRFGASSREYVMLDEGAT